MREREEVEEWEGVVGAHRTRRAWSGTCGDSREVWPEAPCVRFSYGFMALILQDRFGFEDTMRYGNLRWGGATICERGATAPPHGSFIPMTDERTDARKKLPQPPDVAGSTRTKKDNKTKKRNDIF